MYVHSLTHSESSFLANWGTNPLSLSSFLSFSLSLPLSTKGRGGWEMPSNLRRSILYSTILSTAKLSPSGIRENEDTYSIEGAGGYSRASSTNKASKVCDWFLPPVPFPRGEMKLLWDQRVVATFGLQFVHYLYVQSEDFFFWITIE